ncbi:nucleotide-binding domain-containing protein [Hesseltinella vesiculosa]|uniref:Nucleotide-binding domain-containing protein n=1 Tax=Hesseltinella vesiculosa TaxID=101127 RepID=A0A1X2GMU1_9FUNG|nr:nucleotide-binding domain-containing protein [Hesseltinella vesiculosa]
MAMNRLQPLLLQAAKRPTAIRPVLQRPACVFYSTTKRQKLRWFGRVVTLSALVGGAYVVYSLRSDLEYRSDGNAIESKVNPLALHPERGGAKNLPIVSHQLDDYVMEKSKPRLVIIGSGWGAVSLVKNLDKEKYNVTVVSENNYFLFTPLLPSATVGTLEIRSLLEPVRKIVARVCGHFLEGKAVDVDVANKLVEIQHMSGEEGSNFYVPYDHLVIAVGSTSISKGVQGIEHTFQLKSVADARAIRKRILQNLEQACLPTTTPEERKRLLSFVIIGGGPTGSEVAAEINDMIQEDLPKWFPRSLKDEVQVTLVQSRDHILNTYDSEISKYAEERFRRDKINVITNARVETIEKDKVVYRSKGSGDPDQPERHEVPQGFCLWATGIDMTPFARQLANHLGSQTHSRVLQTDTHLRLDGVEKGSIFALGDCASIRNPKLCDRIIDIFEKADLNHDGYLDMDEFNEVVRRLSRRYPLSKEHLRYIWAHFEDYDADHNGKLDVQELRTMLKDVDSKMTHLPATAQVASQQGQYLAKYFNALTKYHGDAEKVDTDLGAFDYHHMGSLSYIGNTAVGEFNLGGDSHFKMLGGLWALYLWRSVYWSEQVSLRTRLNLSIDWTRLMLAGRDISSF